MMTTSLSQLQSWYVLVYIRECGVFSFVMVVIFSSYLQAWAVLTIAVLVAVFARRKNYALFQYTHHAVWFFFFAALLHAWTHWYYMIGGLSLYLLDKLTRLVKSSRQVTLLRISNAAGITRLEVSADFLFNSDRYFAGQYAFINIPSIALLQWHPFTISSAPQSADGLHGERVLTFHIKEQHGWTKDLAQLALSNPRASDIVLSIDGPYGRAGHYFEKQCVIMVAGGIGITPFHSIASDLFTRASQPDVYGPPGSLKHVHVVWVVRDAALLQLFADTFADILRNNPYGMFSLHLFCTNSARPVANKGARIENGESGVRLLSQDGISLLGTSDVLPAEVGMCNPANALLLNTKVTYGRPNLETIFAAVARDTPTASQSTVTAMVCGPEQLVHQVSHLSFQHNFDFHSEVFHF
jgi:NAD(P)H-flavin reductase